MKNMNSCRIHFGNLFAYRTPLKLTMICDRHWVSLRGGGIRHNHPTTRNPIKGSHFRKVEIFLTDPCRKNFDVSIQVWSFPG